MKPVDAARRVGMAEDDFRSINSIPPRMLIKAGSTLLVARSDATAADVAPSVADNGQMALAPEVTLKRSVVRARKGDTVASLAQRFNVTAANVAEWNKFAASSSLKKGQAVVMFTPSRATASRSSAQGSKRTPAAARHAPAAAKRAGAREPAKAAHRTTGKAPSKKTRR